MGSSRVVSGLALAALLFTGGSATAQQELAPKEGQPFPEIDFPLLDGSGFSSLSSYRGEKVLLMQFASW